MSEHPYIHCDCSELFLTLHDCVVDKANFRDGVLCFEFRNGFWISPEHPASTLTHTVRTDAAKVEFVLDNGDISDGLAYVFTKTLFGKTVREVWTLQRLFHSINGGTCSLEILSHYTDEGKKEHVLDCQLYFPKKHCFKECQLRIFSSQVKYCWNHLREDCVW